MSGGSPYRAAEPPEPGAPDRFLLWVALTPLVVLLSAVLCGLLSLVTPLLAILLQFLVVPGWSFARVICRGEHLHLRVLTMALLGVTGLFSVREGTGELALWFSSGEVTASEVPAHRWARVFPLREATTRPRLLGRYVDHPGPGSRRSTTVAEVVPLVGPDWTPASPVPAWAVYPWQGEGFVPQPRFAVRTRSLVIEEHERASQDAMTRHGLRQVPGAPVLEVGESARAVIAERCQGTFVSTAVIGVPWLLVAAVSWWRQPRHRRAPS